MIMYLNKQKNTPFPTFNTVKSFIDSYARFHSSHCIAPCYCYLPADWIFWLLNNRYYLRTESQYLKKKKRYTIMTTRRPSSRKAPENLLRIIRKEQEPQQQIVVTERDDNIGWIIANCCFTFLALGAAIAALIWLALLDLDSGSEGPAGLACWDTNGDGRCTLPGEDTDGSGSCDVNDCGAAVDDEWLVLVDAAPFAPPCTCSNALAINRCDVLFPGKLVKYFNKDQNREFFCNMDAGTGQWWSVEELYFFDDQNDGCPNGFDFTTTPNVNCAIEFGGDEGSITPRAGTLLERDIVVTGFTYSDNGDADATCAPVGSGAFNLNLITSTTGSFVGFTPFAVLQAGITSSNLIQFSLNINVQAGRWIGVEMQNDCGLINDAITDYGVKVRYRITDRYYP